MRGEAIGWYGTLQGVVEEEQHHEDVYHCIISLVRSIDLARRNCMASAL